MTTTEINVIWLNFHPEAPSKGYWCYGWLEEILISDHHGGWKEPPALYQGKWINDVPEGEGAIVVIPAEYNANNVNEINAALSLLPWAVVILASDEQGLFPVEDLDPVKALWVMTPHFEKHTYPPNTNFIGEFYPQDARERIAKFKSQAMLKPLQCSFSGQITHDRRHRMVEALAWVHYINQTAGFTQGLGRDAYYRLMSMTRCTPAPSGPVTLDSFRAFECLEAGGIPILDTICPVPQDGTLYWDEILGKDHPLPTIEDWHEAHKIVDDVDDNWPLSSNLVFSWWQMHKRSVRHRILDDADFDHGEYTILIPTSPIPSHPSTTILDETIASVRFHHPYADILVMCDGIRPEQEHRRDDYDKYVQEVCWKANFEWHNVYPIVFAGHEHQASMTRVALDYVRTPLIVFVEHDTPLVTDEPIPWEDITRFMHAGYADVLRFHFEAHVHPEHERMMTTGVEYPANLPVRYTVQWSQRPHVARTEYYRKIIRDHFPPASSTMIEDKLHSVAQQWPEDHRIAIFHPETGNIKRSLHTDGRGDDEKYPMRFE